MVPLFLFLYRKPDMVTRSDDNPALPLLPIIISMVEKQRLEMTSLNVPGRQLRSFTRPVTSKLHIGC